MHFGNSNKGIQRKYIYIHTHFFFFFLISKKKILLIREKHENTKSSQKRHKQPLRNINRRKEFHKGKTIRETPTLRPIKEGPLARNQMAISGFSE